MNVKYHYEVYDKTDKEGGIFHHRYKTYDDADEARGHDDDWGIDKYRTVSPNFADLPTAKTYEEAVQVIKDGGTLWTELMEDPDNNGDCMGTEDLETLAEETEDGKEFETNHYHMEDSVAPPSERLGECVDGDLEAPMNCEVCDEDLWNGDTIYIDAMGYVSDEGFPEANQDEQYGATCVDCQGRISDAIDDVKEKIAFEAEKRRNG